MLRSQLPCIQKRTLFQKYSNPSRLSYVANKSYISLIWNNLIPQPLKLTCLVASGIVTFVNVHPRYYITLGPPVGLLGFFGYQKYRHWQYHKAVSKLDVTKWQDNEIIRIAKYDEKSLDNVIMGIDNQYDSLRRQIIQLVEQRIIEYILEHGVEDEITRSFISDDNQFNVHLPELEIESWVTTNVKLEKNNDTVSEFIMLSVPYYDSKNVHTRKRLGVVLIYLLQIPQQEHSSFIDYKIGIEVTRLRWINPQSLFFTKLESKALMQSDIYKSLNKENQN